MLGNHLINHFYALGYYIPEKKDDKCIYTLYKQLPSGLNKKITRKHYDRKEAFGRAQSLANRYGCNYFVEWKSDCLKIGNNMYCVEPTNEEH